jgi:nicotinate-nucleotide adenylyltransferase
MGLFGIMGGTFDPIHYGHLVLAEKAREAYHLEKVIFVPAAVPPHKIGEVAASGLNRLEMAELAIKDNPNFEVSAVELKREGPSYSIDTLRQLKKEHFGMEAAFIMGFDSLLELHSWKDYQDLLVEAKVITAFRPGYPTLKDQADLPQFLKLYHDRILFLEAPLLDISSTWLRVELMYDRSIRYLVPETVREYIIEKRIYRDF